MPARTGWLSEDRGEPLHPSIQRDVVDLDTAPGEQFFKIAVREVVAQALANYEQNHIRREPEPGERRSRRRGRSNHPGTVTQ